MNCRKVRSYLSASYDGSLNAELTQDLETHVRTCKSCEREQYYRQEIVIAAKSLPQQHLPDDFNLQLMNRIFAEQQKPTESYLPQPAPSMWRRPLAWTSSLAVVGVCAVLALVFLRSDQNPTLMPEAEMATVSPSQVIPATYVSVRHQEPISVYENIIGVSGQRSQYRATSIQNVRSLQVDRAKIDSLRRAYLQQLNSPRVSTAFVYAGGFQPANLAPVYGAPTPVRRVQPGSPLLQNASSR